MRKKYRIKPVYIAVLWIIATLLIPKCAFAKEVRYVRIGLTDFTDSKSEISISNTRLSAGYCINNKYKAEAVLKSSRGFCFQPAKEYYYISKEKFLTYPAARETANLLKKAGIDAFAGVTYQKTWRVYVCAGKDKKKGQRLFKKINGRYGLTYSSIQKDNKRRVKVSGTDEKWMVDTDSHKAYIQFAAENKNASEVAVLKVEKSAYRGRIEIGRYGKQGSGKALAVNILPVESYLYGVVPCEMPDSWHMEALKAQAVCSRSLCLTRTSGSADSNAEKGFSMDDTVSGQRYRGYNAEKPRSTKAVKAVQGKKITYKKKTAAAYFFSSSGGSTEASEDAFSSPVPYLRRTPDLYELEPEKEPWVLSFTKKQFQAKLSAAGQQTGNIKNIIPEITTASNRVYSLRFEGEKKSCVFRSDKLRNVLDLYSTKFKIITCGDKPDEALVSGAEKSIKKRIQNMYTISGKGTVGKIENNVEQFIAMSSDNMTNFPREAPKNKDTYFIAGMGHGHGVGMSQSGANGMAKAGFSYKKILTYYFRGVTVN